MGQPNQTIKNFQLPPSVILGSFASDCEDKDLRGIVVRGISPTIKERMSPDDIEKAISGCGDIIEKRTDDAWEICPDLSELVRLAAKLFYHYLLGHDKVRQLPSEESYSKLIKLLGFGPKLAGPLPDFLTDQELFVLSNTHQCVFWATRSL